MSAVKLYFSVQKHTADELTRLADLLEQADQPALAKPLGAVLSDLACEVIEQVFLELLKISRAWPESQAGEMDQSGTVIASILANIRKFLPYAVCLMSNARLAPMVRYLQGCMHQSTTQSGKQDYISYPLPQKLFQAYQQDANSVNDGNIALLPDLFQHLIDIIDVGVAELIIKPKQILKFNFVVNKTLDGVIQLSTRMGYQRLHKVATELNREQAMRYLEHFEGFFHPE